MVLVGSHRFSVVLSGCRMFSVVLMGSQMFLYVLIGSHRLSLVLSIGVGSKMRVGGLKSKRHTQNNVPPQ